MEITYKEFFEKAKRHPKMQAIIIQAFVTATKMVCKVHDKNIDVGDLVLNSIATMAKSFSGVELINKEEITAEYMADTLNQYQDKHNKPINPT